MTNHLSTRLEALEKKIAEQGLDLYLVPMVDAFQSEYIPAFAARLPYVTGFTGSAGFGAFWAKPTEAARHVLFTDGRYTLQAADEVDTQQITVINSGDMSFKTWLSQQAENRKLRIGFDPWLITIEQYTAWQRACPDCMWVAVSFNLVDRIWPDQPSPPAAGVELHPITYAGTAYDQKKAALLGHLARHKADALILTQPDAINWLLNIRGNDIPFNPLLLGYLLLTAQGEATLYAEPREISAAVQHYFAEQQVAFQPISEVFGAALKTPADGAKLLIDPSVAAYGWQAIAEAKGWKLVHDEDPTALPKALKNSAELAGIRAAHLRDGLALTRFLHWFDAQCGQKKFPDELEVVAKLEAFRAMDKLYRGASFATIAGSGPHGAIIHYRADEKSNRRVRSGELFLLDSGGQYPDGTTDVTRTIAVGTPSPAMKEHVTRVLKGHIALACAQFPVGTSGVQLDSLARQYLWEAGLDYDHGTGHGVGAYLCVHEGPQRISKRGSSVALQPGMILSNEPGYYAPGEYGIRIESLLAVIEVASASGRPMLAFETLTLAPIDTHLVDTTMLTSRERNWLNQYHARVFKAHEAALDTPARQWLEQATRAI